MSFRRRNYPEVTDHLVNRVLGGVSGEQHAYPPPNAAREPFTHALARSPVADITSVYGLVNGVSAPFAKGVDYELDSDKKRLLWKAGTRPDAGSVVDVNYLPEARETRVNDLFPGSVLRTLIEAFALETAGFYAQLEVVYRSGFLDTAESGALDHVVSLLGVQRVRAGRNVAEVELSRTRSTRGEVVVPAGTRVLTADGAIEYETVADITLADGQPSARGSARDTVASNDGVPAGSLTLLAKPFAGLDGVNNPSPSTRLDRDESDVELRARAKSFLAGSERGTLGAIKEAIAREGVLADVSDSEPGFVSILVHDDQLSPEQKKRLESAVEAARPAGVRAPLTYGAAPMTVDLALRLSTAEGLLETDLKRIQGEVAARIADYFKKLPVKSNGSVTKLIGLAMGVDGVEDVTVVSATTPAGGDVLDAAAGELKIKDFPTELGALRIVDPALATLLSVVVRHRRDQELPNRALIQAALQSAASYLSELTLSAASPLAKRTLSWGKLALATPLPGKAATALADFDANPAGFTLPTAAALPAIAGEPYTLAFVLTRPTGVSQVLPNELAPTFELGAFERLNLSNLTVEVKPKGSGA